MKKLILLFAMGLSLAFSNTVSADVVTIYGRNNGTTITTIKEPTKTTTTTHIDCDNFDQSIICYTVNTEGQVNPGNPPKTRVSIFDNDGNVKTTLTGNLENYFPYEGGATIIISNKN